MASPGGATFRLDRPERRAAEQEDKVKFVKKEKGIGEAVALAPVIRRNIIASASMVLQSKWIG